MYLFQRSNPFEDGLSIATGSFWCSQLYRSAPASRLTSSQDVSDKSQRRLHRVVRLRGVP